MVDEGLKAAYGVQWFRQGKKFVTAWQRPDFKQYSPKIKTHGYMLYKTRGTCCTVFPNKTEKVSYLFAIFLR